MSKVKDDTTITQPNYDAQKWLSWFITDCQNTQGLCGNVFRGSYDSSDPRFTELLTAAINSITEVQNDITQLQQYLAAYNPQPNSVKIDTKSETNQ